MSVTLRVGLLLGALVIFGLVCYEVRQNHIRVGDSVFWVVFSLVLVFFAIVPQAAYAISRLIGVESPSNFVFAVVIGILIGICVYLSAKVSMLTNKLHDLASQMALNCHDRKESDCASQK